MEEDPERDLSSKDHIDSGEQQFQLSARELAHALGEKTPVQGHNLRDVRHRVAREPSEAGRERDVPGRDRPSKVAGQRHAHGSRDPAPVQGIALHNHNWPSKSRTGPRRSGQIGPPDFTLRDHHSLRSRIRRVADETNWSVGYPKSAHTRSMASVTSSGACRATYSLSASLNNWLRDFFVRRASRSAPWNTSSGIETAVFIPSV
jgi:hypothetical protein